MPDAGGVDAVQIAAVGAAGKVDGATDCGRFHWSDRLPSVSGTFIQSVEHQRGADATGCHYHIGDIRHRGGDEGVEGVVEVDEGGGGEGRGSTGAVVGEEKARMEHQQCRGER